MPYICISTSVALDNKKKLLEEISILISSLTNKSKRFVMAKLDNDSQMYFDDETDCCFIEIKSIGSINPVNMVKPICNFINSYTGIPLDKIYISFEDISPTMWGWNGKTFG